MIGHPGGEYRNPDQLGAHTAITHVYVDDVATHFERARAAGARITREPAEEAYGDRRYDCEDLEGHVWSFAEAIENVPAEQWGATSA